MRQWEPRVAELADENAPVAVAAEPAPAAAAPSGDIPTALG
jgi:hypothetical protein